MREISSEHNTTTFLPMPIDLFSAFLEEVGEAACDVELLIRGCASIPITDSRFPRHSD